MNPLIIIKCCNYIRLDEASMFDAPRHRDSAKCFYPHACYDCAESKMIFCCINNRKTSSLFLISLT